MAAALVTLIQAVMPKEASPTKEDPQKDGDLIVAKSQQAKAGSPRLPNGTPLSAFTEMTNLATQIAKLDEMIFKAQEEAPMGVETEAQKWHEVSVQALKWTRAALEKQQQQVLLDVRSSLLASKDADDSPSGKVAPAGRCPQAQPLQATHAEPATQPPPGFEPKAAEERPIPPWRLPRARAVEPLPVKDQPKPADEIETEEAKQQRQLHPGVGSLRADLENLRRCDASVCIIVRRIKRLGLESPALLREHFSRHGPVKQVLVSHSFEKPSAKRRHGRVRPAALGFLIMETPEAAEAVVAAGPEHTVAEVEVSVQMFQPFMDLASLTADC